MPSDDEIEKFMRHSNLIEGEKEFVDCPHRIIGALGKNDVEGAGFFLANDLNEENLKKAHGIIFKGSGEKWGYPEKKWVGKYKPGNNQVGNHIPPSYLKTPKCMEEYFEALPTMDAFEAHNEFANIHPFLDGNGRMARLVWWWKSLYNESHYDSLTFLHNIYYEMLNHQNSRSRFK